jgi:outer membrane protein assembly factor BamB
LKLRIVVYCVALTSACAFVEPEVGPLRESCMSEGGVSAADASTGVPGYSSATAESCTTKSDAVSGNVLIADQLNNRVIEVTRTGALVWTFGDGKSVPGPTSVVAPNDAERLPNGRTLISGTGAPLGAEPSCALTGGAACSDNRVIIVDDASGAIVWQYGADRGRAGRGPDELDSPVAAVLVPKGSGDDILITDQGNNRIIEVSEQTKQIVWQFPSATSNTSKNGAKEALQSPNSAERLANGDTLIADENGNRVIEVDGDSAITWQYPTQIDLSLLNGPAFASRLPDGHTLITDSNNSRVLEVDAETPAKVVWMYSTASRDPSLPASFPTRAVRLADGHTLISDQLNDQVIEIDASPKPYVVYSYGKLGVAGRVAGELDAPYDAKVIGDYTGLTSPM